MARVEVIYGGQSFMIVGRDIDDVQQQIDDILALGASGWLTAYDGHGTQSPYRLLITRGVPLAIARPPAGD